MIGIRGLGPPTHSAGCHEEVEVGGQDLVAAENVKRTLTWPVKFEFRQADFDGVFAGFELRHRAGEIRALDLVLKGCFVAGGARNQECVKGAMFELAGNDDLIITGARDFLGSERGKAQERSRRPGDGQGNDRFELQKFTQSVNFRKR